jgi:histidine triad (HIT) family protein
MKRFFRWVLHFSIIKRLVGWIFTRASFLVPGERLRETSCWLSIRHPRPGYPVHFLILPKKPWQNLLDIPVAQPGLLEEALDIAQSLVREYGLEEKGYRLIVNGGNYQGFPHLHIHLVSGDAFPEQ